MSDASVARLKKKKGGGGEERTVNLPSVHSCASCYSHRVLDSSLASDSVVLTCLQFFFLQFVDLHWTLVGKGWGHVLKAVTVFRENFIHPCFTVWLREESRRKQVNRLNSWPPDFLQKVSTGVEIRTFKERPFCANRP